MPSHVSPRSPGALALLAVLVVLKAAAWFAWLPHGLEASYFASPQWKDPAATRIEAALILGGERANEPPSASAIWRAYVPVRVAADRQPFYLRGKGLTAELWVDGIQAVHLEAPAEEAVERAAWPAITHRLVVRVTRQPESSPSPRTPLEFDAGLVMTDGTKVPFDERMLLLKPASRWRIAADRAARPLNTVVNILLVSMLMWAAWYIFPPAWQRFMRAVDFMVPPEEQ